MDNDNGITLYPIGSDPSEMNVVKFDHDYTKLHGQKSGFLCWVTPFLIDKNFTDEAYQYDTDGMYPLEKGKIYMQLVFLGDKEIPFTTYREDTPENRAKYVGKVGQVFRFIIKEDN